VPQRTRGRRSGVRFACGRPRA